MRAVLVLVMLAGPGWAEPWIDYDLLFQQNADKVIVTTDASGEVTRSLDLGEGVTVFCTDQGCVGADQKGAVGCAWSISSHLLAVAEVCGIPKERTVRTTDYHRLMTAFVARNAVPPRSVAEIEGFHQSQIDQYRNGGEDEPLDCAEVMASDSDVMMMLEAIETDLASAAAEDEEDESFDIDAFLATPRLPVMNPCL